MALLNPLWVTSNSGAFACWPCEWLAAHDRHGAIRFDVAAITGVHIEVFEAAF